MSSSSIKSRLQHARQKLLRRGSAVSTGRSVASSAANSSLRKSISLSQLAVGGDMATPHAPPEVLRTAHNNTKTTPATTTTATMKNSTAAHTAADTPATPICPVVTLEAPTPIHPAITTAATTAAPTPGDDTTTLDSILPTHIPHAPSPSPSPSTLPSSTLPSHSHSPSLSHTPSLSSGGDTAPIAFTPMAATHRKIWVKRPHASATLVQIGQDDLVDDVRDMILRKYANSLGRSFDAPDVTLRIVARDPQRGQDRTLGPEEDICRTLDAYFPGGQHVQDALLIEVPPKRTPKPSPRVPICYPYHDDAAAAAATTHQTEYFPPMPVASLSPAIPGVPAPHDARISLPHASHSIAVLNTGQLPPLPSPGGSRRGPLHSHRPKYPRTHTASPTTMASTLSASAAAAAAAAPRSSSNRPRQNSSASESKHPPVAANNAMSMPIPTPPAPVDAMARQQTLHTSTPSTPRIASPILKEKRRKKRPPLEPPSLPAGLLDGSVPPINVLIVEDNIINLRVLGAFMQRLKVRWQRAMNGKEAVTKWKTGGFHLVLMDIQLPVMNGLEATKEIRRLERVNGIGVFSSGSSETANQRPGDDAQEEIPADDQLHEKNMFKSPVIIVALTASSLQSDRHEALAAGCNDFLTKPVNFVWLERKVKEWGCMQALIDFDGWRKWKDFADKSDNNDSTSKLSVSYHSIAPNKKTTASPTSAAHSELNAAKDADKERKAKRKSLNVAPPPVLAEELDSPPVEAG